MAQRRTRQRTHTYTIHDCPRCGQPMMTVHPVVGVADGDGYIRIHAACAIQTVINDPAYGECIQYS